ncbi:MAG: NAD+ synthase [Polyangiaceae bacterium]|nr:NAD+ synthase [Polyangiaceae bacterium]
MRVGIAQINTRIGDLAGNAGRILAAARAAEEDGAEIVLFPELCVTGFPPRDLLLNDAFVNAAIAATERIARALEGSIPALVGTVLRAPERTPGHPGLYNAMALLSGGRVAASRKKRLLPVYDVFYEPRWFVPGPSEPPISIADQYTGICICEDLWSEGYAIDPPRELRAAGAEILFCASASPYRAGVLDKRLRHARRAGGPLVYVNAVGAHDELIFDGGSFVLNSSGDLIAMLPRFEEAVAVIDTNSAAHPELPAPLPIPLELFRALVLGVRDFAQKNGVRRAFLGLSGGIDSALVACIAADALGPSAVTALALPSRHSDPRSTTSARELAASLGIGFEEASIEPLHRAFEETLAPLLAGAPEGDTTAENIQARLRAVVLMAHVNRRGGVLLNTSNKTEITLGYGTLYGDMAGTLSVLGDLTKTEVYAIARHLHKERGLIPAFILERPPSAELRPGQVDPFDYDKAAPLAEALVQSEAGGGLLEGPPDEIAKFRRLIRGAEHKRWQAGIVLKVSERAFGSGRMMPVTRVL